MKFIKIKNVGASKDTTVKRLKGQPRKCEKISGYHLSYTGLVFWI